MFALLMAMAAAQAGGSEDPLSVFSGDWQMVDTQSEKVVRDCKTPQRFAVAPDRKTVTLTDGDWSARYLVLRSGSHRVLMFIENEERTTEEGDPVLWWANFEGPDRFRWRRYDWAADDQTAVEWRRCPSKK